MLTELSTMPAPAAVEGDELDAAAQSAFPGTEDMAPDMSWWPATMKTHDQRMAWWREARFGVMVTWGVYSHLGGVWEGRVSPGYSEHIMRKGKITVDRYLKEVAAHFNPTAFDADAWVRLFKEAGIRYAVFMPKHHDGFAMYDSKVTDYDVVDATPFARDPMVELAAACKQQGLRLGFYYSHAQEWGHPYGSFNNWEFDHPREGRWWTKPKYRRQYENFHVYVTEKAVPQITELVTRYDPDMIWFDTALCAPQDANARVMKAARMAKPSLVINNRSVLGNPGGGYRHYGDYASTADKPAEFRPVEGDWEAIPTINESYGYHRKDLSHKPPSHFVKLLIKAVARGGNMLMNVGPRGDGKIDDKDVAVLEGIGRWMKVNGESIYGCGRSGLPIPAWGESTRRGNTLYVHVFDWPKDGTLVVGGLKTPVRRARLLSDPARRELETERLSALDVRIEVPREAPDATASVVALELDGEPETDPARLLLPTVQATRFHVFDAALHGEVMRYGKGHPNDDYMQAWTQADEHLSWPVRATEPATYEVVLKYTARKHSGGVYRLELGDQSWEGRVKPGPMRSVSLGRFEARPGWFDMTLRAVSIDGRELMNPHAVFLTVVR
jgi:alpha-L-fucosidase